VNEIAAGVTDILLGGVLVGCATRLQSSETVHQFWALMYWTAGAGAFAGALHHLVFNGSKRASDLSWVVVGVLVAVAISYLLAASAFELVDPRLARLFIGLRIGGLVAYVVVITTTGVGRTLPLVLSESVTMTSIVTLWVYGIHIGHPRARAILVALGVCALSALAVIIPYSGPDPRWVQHVAQIPGVLLLARALLAPVPARPEGSPASHHVGS
jgi:hypothetical protein